MTHLSRLKWPVDALYAAVVRFSREAARQDALAQLGGGIRGKFRVQRARLPQSIVTPTRVSAAPRQAALPAGDVLGSMQPDSNGPGAVDAGSSNGEWHTVAPRARSQGAFVPPHRRVANSTDA